MDLDLLASRLDELGQPAFRARQVWAWAARGVEGYDAMTDLPRALRERLAEEVPFSTLELADQAESRDGTVKALFRTAATGARSRRSSCATATGATRSA